MQQKWAVVIAFQTIIYFSKFEMDNTRQWNFSLIDTTALSVVLE